jgi:integrase
LRIASIALTRRQEHWLNRSLGKFAGNTFLTGRICTPCNVRFGGTIDLELARTAHTGVTRQVLGIEGRASHERKNVFEYKASQQEPPVQGRRLLEQSTPSTPRALRDHAMVAMLIGCGLHRAELLALTLESIQQREEHWVIADLVGKGGHVRTVPIPGWVKAAVDTWTDAVNITHGPAFRATNKAGRIWGNGMSPKVLWDVVRAAAGRAGIDKLAPHDLRRTYARLCHLAGGELDQIQFLLGHVSIQTTERYLGCKQRLRCAVNDRLGIEPDALEL